MRMSLRGLHNSRLFTEAAPEHACAPALFFPILIAVKILIYLNPVIGRAANAGFKRQNITQRSSWE